MQKINMSILLLFALLTQQSYAFVNSLVLIEANENNKILLIGDRHIEQNGAPQDLLQKELSDISSIKGFANTLISKRIKHGWILESSNSEIKMASKEAVNNELLYALPNFLIQKKTSSVLSDHRREFIRNLFITAHSFHIHTILQEGMKKLHEMKAWTIEDMEWLIEQSDLLPELLMPKIEYYWKSNLTFRRHLETVISNLSYNFKNAEILSAGEYTTIDSIKIKLQELTIEVHAAEKTLHKDHASFLLDELNDTLSTCNQGIETFKNETGAKDNSSLVDSVLAKAKKERSFKPINDLTQTDLSHCVTSLIPEMGFLVDVLANQKTHMNTIAFFGHKHVSRIYKQLQNLGYQVVFQEGTFELDEGSEINYLNRWNESDNPLSKEDLKARLIQTLKAFFEEKIGQKMEL